MSSRPRLDFRQKLDPGERVEPKVELHIHRRVQTANVRFFHAYQSRDDLTHSGKESRMICGLCLQACCLTSTLFLLENLKPLQLTGHGTGKEFVANRQRKYVLI